jgi:hypothetical protein
MFYSFRKVMSRRYIDYIDYLSRDTVWDRLFRLRKKTFYRQVLKLGANEASAQGLQNAL